jgi:hypothetical protein
MAASGSTSAPRRALVGYAVRKHARVVGAAHDPIVSDAAAVVGACLVSDGRDERLVVRVSHEGGLAEPLRSGHEEVRVGAS